MLQRSFGEETLYPRGSTLSPKKTERILRGGQRIEVSLRSDLGQAKERPGSRPRERSQTCRPNGPETIRRAPRIDGPEPPYPYVNGIDVPRAVAPHAISENYKSHH